MKRLQWMECFRWLPVVCSLALIGNSVMFSGCAKKSPLGSGQGSAPQIGLVVRTHNFGEIQVGNYLDWEFTLSNLGDATLTVNTITSDNPAFTIPSPDFPQDISAGDSLDITVRFSPTQEKPYSGTLTIASNDPDEPEVRVSVKGKGVKPLSAAAFWYPGDINSYWVYDVSSITRSTATLAGKIEIDGREYKRVVEEGWSLIGDGPFLIFRHRDTPNQILGYGVDKNESYEELVIGACIEAGFPLEFLDIQGPSDEWVLLESPAVGQGWTVMKLEFQYAPSFSTRGTATIKIQASIPRTEKVKTEAGEFEAFVVDYTLNYSIVLIVDWQVIDKETDEEPLATMWLVPNVGFVKMVINDTIGTLVEYDITANQPLVASFTHSPGKSGLKREGLALMHQVLGKWMKNLFWIGLKQKVALQPGARIGLKDTRKGER